MNDAQIELPKYQCHKKVWALKIKEIALDKETAEKENRETDGSALMSPQEPGYAPIILTSEYMLKHKPVVGGYYIVYEDGYKSFSPAEAFESGYAKI